MGVILNTVGDTQYHGGYHDARGGYYEYLGGCPVPWEIPSFVICLPLGDIMVHVEGYHEYHGGTQITQDFSPHGTHNIPHGTEHTLYMMQFLLGPLMVIEEMGRLSLFLISCSNNY